MSRKQTKSIEEMARQRAEYLTGLMWHAGAFVIINIFFWLLDGLGYGGVNWAFWITLFWGFALAFHALAYWVDGRQVEEAKTRQYIKESGEIDITRTRKKTPRMEPRA